MKIEKRWIRSKIKLKDNKKGDLGEILIVYDLKIIEEDYNKRKKSRN